MALLTYNWQEPDFTGLISNALHGEEQQRLQAMQQAEQQRLAMKQASDLSLQLRQEARMAGNERFRQQLEATREGREQATSDSLIAHRKAQDDYNYGPGGDVDLSGLLSNGGGTGATGGIGSDASGRYSYDPDTGSLITPVSSFGGVADVTTGQDNGLFGTGGASVLKADGTPISESDVSDVRAHPERYRDNPEPYAAFPSSMYKSGAVKAGEKYWVSAPDKDGNDHWAQVTARDVGPSAKNRGLDVNPTVLDALGVGTDAKVRVYVPGAENIVSGGAPAAGGTPDLSASIRNLPPAQQAAIARAAVTARIRAQGNPSMEDLGNGNVRINGSGSVYHQNDDGTMTKVGAGGSSSGPKVKDNFTDDDGNIYTQLTDGTWQGGKVPPPGAQKVGTKRAGGQESDAKLSVMYSRAQTEEKQAQAELDAMRKQDEDKEAKNITQGYPWREGGKMYRVNGEGKRVEVENSSDYDALVSRADKAQRWAQTVKRAREQQEEVWAKMNGEAPPQSAPSGSTPPPPKDTSEQVLQMPTPTASGSVPATPIPPSPPNITPTARPAAQASGGIPPIGVLGPELGPSARKNMADLAATINAGVVPKSEWAVQYQNELKSQQMHGQRGAMSAAPAPSGKIRAISPDGKAGFIPAEKKDAALKAGWRLG